MKEGRIYKVAKEFFTVTKNAEGVVTVTFMENCQKIDAKNFEDIQTKAINLLQDDDKIAEFVFDLDNVIYVSSAGLRMFSSVNKVAQERDVEYRLVNLRKDILKMFQLTGYASIFRIEQKVVF